MKFPRAWISTVLGVLLVGSLGANVYGYYYFTHQIKSSTTLYQKELSTQESLVASTTAANNTLQMSLDAETAKNNSYGQQVDTISSTVADLSKLATIDPQLLAKYSKVYFLNENYKPAKLATITPEYTLEKDRTYQFEADAQPFLMNMLEAASSTGTSTQMVVASAYRSFGQQAVLKSEYKVTYGSGANTFSADQGYSEHQLGTAVDLSTTKLGGNFNAFSKTDAYQWLVDNAYKYGFILSYPPNNSYYQYEPWHWRFVGVKLATMLHTEHEYFYDLDQRQITPYLITLFDPQ